MKAIVLIAKNTYREIIRDRILYGLVVFAVILIGLSMALGQLSYAEQTRISIDYGLMGIHMSAVLLSIFVGSTLVARELDKRTIMTLLAHAVTRKEFILGKFLGMIFVLLTVLTALFFILYLILSQMEFTLSWNLPAVLWGTILESMILLSITLFFGIFTSSVMAVTFTLGLFLIGHWVGDLNFFAQKSGSESFKLFSQLAQYLVPNLERFNWRAYVTYSENISASVLVEASVYGLSWSAFFLIVGIIVFRRRDFV
ncbi:MAG: ABC transporter permease [Bdellovibrionales bacterium]